MFYASFGGGHKAAAESIAEALNKNPNIECLLVDGMRYASTTINKLAINIYMEILKFSKKTFKSIYSSSNNEGTATKIISVLKLLGIRLIPFLKKEKPDLIISTHPFTNQACAYLKKKNKFNFELDGILTDFEIHKLWYYYHEYIDNIYVSSQSMKDDLVLDGVYSNKIHITGIPIKEAFTTNYSKDEVYHELGLNKNRKTIVFFGGGNSGTSDKDTYKLFELTLKYLKDYNIIAISGKNPKAAKKMQAIIRKNRAELYTYFYEFSTKIPEIFSVSEFIITKPGGLTTSEALASGLPILVISPLPGPEKANTKFIVDHQAGLYLDSVETAKEVFFNIINHPETIKILSSNAKSLGKPFATQTIYDQIIHRFDLN